MNLVEFRGVRKSYDGKVLVVRNLDLEIPKGEFLTLLGPSGSGKTTCLMMLAGFEQATEGDILLNGKQINSMPPHKRGIGMVFQSYALFPHMNVAENIGYPLRMRGIRGGEAASKIQRGLEMVRLPEFADRRPSQLSGGQQQRVALARALVFEPELVLMDEPLGALDKNLREEMQYEIKHLHERLGLTVVYVTHDQSEALTMSDRIAVFDQGEIQQLAAPTALYEQPSNAFVADFVGENNHIPGRLSEGEEPHVANIVCDDGSILVGASITDLLPDSHAQLTIRPESIQITKDGAHAARILAKIYHGDHIRLRCQAFGLDTLIVKAPRHVACDFEVGQDIKIAWHSGDARIFAMEDAK